MGGGGLGGEVVAEEAEPVGDLAGEGLGDAEVAEGEVWGDVDGESDGGEGEEAEEEATPHRGASGSASR